METNDCEELGAVTFILNKRQQEKKIKTLLILK